MTPDQQAEIKARTAAVAGLAATLQAELLMIGVYQDAAVGAFEGAYDSSIEGAKQAAQSTLAKIEEHLAVLKGYCNA